MLLFACKFYDVSIHTNQSPLFNFSIILVISVFNQLEISLKNKIIELTDGTMIYHTKPTTKELNFKQFIKSLGYLPHELAKEDMPCETRKHRTQVKHPEVRHFWKVKCDTCTAYHTQLILLDTLCTSYICISNHSIPTIVYVLLFHNQLLSIFTF